MLAGGNILYGGDGNDALATSMDYSILNGEAGADELRSFGSASVLEGGAGNDFLQVVNGDGNAAFGGEGDDEMHIQAFEGSPDNNTLSGGAGNDNLTVWHGTGNLLIGGQGNDMLAAGGTGQTLDGGAGNDILVAWSSGNIAQGGQGDDVLQTYGEGNTLMGGPGRDTFTFSSTSSGNVIEDFRAHGSGQSASEIEDVLDIRDVLIGLPFPQGGTSLGDWVEEGYLIVDSSANVAGGAANDTVVQIDGDGFAGPGTAVTLVTVTDSTLGTSGQDANNWLV